MDKKSACGLAPDAPVGHHLVELFWRLGPAFTRWAESHMDEPGLTSQRVRLLLVLMDNGPMTMGDLADRLGVTATNVTALVDALEKDGMAARMPHPTDRRVTLVQITGEASARMEEGCAVFKERVATLFADLDGAEQEMLCVLLGKVRDALTARSFLAEDC